MRMTPSKNTSRITVPEHGHPIARVIFGLMQQHKICYDELCYHAGVNVTTLKAWRREKLPGITAADACLACFDWRLLPVPSLEGVPVEIRDDLQALARRWEGLQPTLCGLIATLAAGYPDPMGTIHAEPSLTARGRRSAISTTETQALA